MKSSCLSFTCSYWPVLVSYNAFSRFNVSANSLCLCHISLKLQRAEMPVAMATSKENIIAYRWNCKETRTGTDAAKIIIGMLKAKNNLLLSLASCSYL